jgi:glycosyltransferase involved in cell wall biosynthesis
MRAAIEAGHKVCLVTSSWGRLTEMLDAEGVRVFILPMERTFYFHRAWQFARLLKAWRADLVHCHDGVVGAILQRVGARLAGVPIINHVHLENTFNARPWIRRLQIALDNSTARLADEIVTISDDTKRSLVRQGIPAKKIRTVPNGVRVGPEPDATQVQNARKALDLDTDGPIIGCVGRLCEAKGQHDLLGAARSIIERVPSAKFIFVGEDQESGGRYREKLEELARTLGIAEAVRFVGFQPDIASLMPAFSLYVLPSYIEGMPLTILEAMAAARPVIATPVGGVPELVAGGEIALLVQPGDPEALAQAILELLDDPDRAEAMGRAGRKRVETHFSLDHTLTKVFALYEEVASRGGKHGRNYKQDLFPRVGARRAVPLQALRASRRPRHHLPETPTIGIDAVHLSRGGKGLSRFEGGLINALALHRSRYNFVVFLDKQADLPSLPRAPHIRYVRAAKRSLMVWEQIQLPTLARRHGMELLLTCSDRVPLLYTKPVLLYLFETPDRRHKAMLPNSTKYQALSANLTGAIFPLSLRKAARIAVSSHSTREELARHHRVPESKMTVIYPGPPATFEPSVDERQRASIKEKLGAPEGYVLHFSSVNDPRDNTETALKAFHMALQGLDYPRKLVIAGKCDLEAQSLTGLVEELGLRPHIILTGYVPDEALADLYRGADLYLDTSLYEGFGFQVLEAMLSGTPVACSNITSLPEVVGDAAILISPQDVEGFACAITRVLCSPVLAAQMRERGIERGRLFNWESTLRQLEQAYSELLPHKDDYHSVSEAQT